MRQRGRFTMQNIGKEHPRPKTQDPRPKTQDPRPKTQDPRPKTQDPRPKTQDARRKTQDARPKTQDPHGTKAFGTQERGGRERERERLGFIKIRGLHPYTPYTERETKEGSTPHRYMRVIGHRSTSEGFCICCVTLMKR